MRLVAWNIRQGGGTRVAGIVEAVAGLNPDVVVVSEYRHLPTGVSGQLAAAGWAEQLASANPAGGYCGLLVASRTPIEQGDLRFDSIVDGHRWLHARVPATGWEIGGAYIPGTGVPPKSDRKHHYWDWLLANAPDLADRNMVIVGDLNTGLRRIDETGATFICADRMAKLLERGWVDGYRCLHGDTRTYSWWSSAGNGFRLDHALLAPAAPTPTGVEYLTEHDGIQIASQPGVRGLSDHAALVVDLPDRP